MHGATLLLLFGEEAELPTEPGRDRWVSRSRPDTWVSDSRPERYVSRSRPEKWIRGEHDGR